MHPVVVSTGLQNDIRMTLLQIKEALFSGSIYVPYTDRLNDGKTPFNYAVRNYIGGLNGEDVRGLIPGKASLTSPVAGRGLLVMADDASSSWRCYPDRNHRFRGLLHP